MSATLEILVASGSILLFNKWLRKNLHPIQDCTEAHLFFRPWGSNAIQLEALANENNIDILPLSGTDTRSETIKNQFIRNIQASPPNFVVFLDDDTFLSESWLPAILQEINSNEGCDVLISIVRNRQPNMMYAGHEFSKGRPNQFYSIRSIDKKPLGPCANGAVVSWKAIEQIYRVDQGHLEVWDPLFDNTPETCLDFSVKLALVKARAKVVPNAFLEHKDPVIQQPNDSESMALKRLTRRYLLYYKYLQGDTLRHALDIIDQEMAYWIRNGIPAQTRRVKFSDIGSRANRARECAIALAAKKELHYSLWRKQMADSEKANYIFRI